MNIYKTIFATIIAYVYVKFVTYIIKLIFDEESNDYNGSSSTLKKINKMNKKMKSSNVYKYLSYVFFAILIMIITFFTEKKPPRLGGIFASIYLFYELSVLLWKIMSLGVKTLFLGSLSGIVIYITVILDARIYANRIFY
tara:strand:- start:459 stop:878 length:420 start_codon:yes stop_codon:yes gene_type:complete